MESPVVLAIIIFSAALSVVGAVLVLIWYRKKKKALQNDTLPDSAREAANGSPELKGWRRRAVAWPVLCVIFAVIILCSPTRTMEQRLADATFTVIPLIFFAIGMKTRLRLHKERLYATVSTDAHVISDGRRVRSGHASYFPQFEFRAGGMSYKVTSRSGSGSRCVHEGERVELYYASENPRVFYVPAMQRHARRLSGLLCGIGIAYPIIGLFAPLLRAVIPV